MTWRDQAECRHLPGDLFFPVRKQGQTHTHVARAAVEACERCPVPDECRRDRGDDLGFRAGELWAFSRSREAGPQGSRKAMSKHPVKITFRIEGEGRPKGREPRPPLSLVRS